MIVCFEKVLAESIHVEAKAHTPNHLPAAYRYMHAIKIGPFVKEHSSLT